jgi:hypothetical protein
MFFKYECAASRNSAILTPPLINLTPKPFARSSEIVLYKDSGTDFLILKTTTSM